MPFFTWSKKVPRWCEQSGNQSDFIHTRLCGIVVSNIILWRDGMERKNTVYLVIIGILVVLLGSVIGLFVYQSKTNTESAKKYEATISELNATITKLENSEKEKNDLIAQYESVYSEIKKSLPELEKADKEISFYEYSCAIVIDNNSKRYHKYGCDDINWDNDFYFWVYTTNEAEHKGYYACPTCH